MQSNKLTEPQIKSNDNPRNFDSLLLLLERRNLCFRNFNAACVKFLEQISTEDLEQLGTIETFQLQRQALIEVIEKLDADFKQSHETLRSEQKISEPSYYKERLQTLAKEKDSLLSSIISLDNEIMQYIDKLRKETIQRLQAVQSGHKTISAYRSPMDNLSNRKTKLDSEA